MMLNKVNSTFGNSLYIKVPILPKEIPDIIVQVGYIIQLLVFGRSAFVPLAQAHLRVLLLWCQKKNSMYAFSHFKRYSVLALTPNK